jgi:hypothetical protein
MHNKGRNMIQKVLYIKTLLEQGQELHELKLIYDSRPVFTLSSDNLESLLDLYAYWLLPLGYADKFNNIVEFNRAQESSLEDTIKITRVA